MGVENGESFQESIRLDNGETIPNRTVVEGESKIAPTELESRFGREGTIIAVFIYLNGIKEGKLSIIDIARSVGIKDRQDPTRYIGASEVEETLKKLDLLRTIKDGKIKLAYGGSQVYEAKTQALNKWYLATGLSEVEVQKLVLAHMNERNGGYDFGLGERSKHAEMPLDDPQLHGLAVVDMPKGESDSLLRDDPPTEQQIAN